MAKKKATGSGIAGIERGVEVDVATLVPDPDNARQHTVRNVNAIQESLGAFGQVEELIVQKGTNVIIAGHGRVMAMRKERIKKATVTLVECDDLTAKAIGIALNRTGDLGTWDESTLATVLKDLENNDMVEGTTFTKREIDKLVDKVLLEEHPEIPGSDLLDIDPTMEGVIELKDEVRFPTTSNYWEIPDLLPEMIPEIPDKIAVWLGDRTPAKEIKDSDAYIYIYPSDNVDKLDFDKTIVALYEDDERFEGAWFYPADYAARLLKRNPYAVISPNFSLWLNMTKVEQLWNIYRSRWVGRYWQEAGLKVIPDANYGKEDTLEWCTSGIPVGAKTISFEVQSGRKEDHIKKMMQNCMVGVIERVKPETLLIYGGMEYLELVEGIFPKSLRVVMTRNRLAIVQEIIERKGKAKKAALRERAANTKSDQAVAQPT